MRCIDVGVANEKCSNEPLFFFFFFCEYVWCLRYKKDKKGRMGVKDTLQVATVFFLFCFLLALAL